MHRSPEFIFFQRESLFRAVGAAIQLNSGIYLLLRRKYVRPNLTHSKVAIIHTEPPFQHQACHCQWQVATQARVSLPTNVAMASLKTLSASFRAYCGVYLNQINFTGELNFRRGHRKVRIGITKEGGLKRG